MSHIPRSENKEANVMARATPGLVLSRGVLKKLFTVEKCLLSSVLKKDNRSTDIITLDVDPNDWQYLIIQFLKDPSQKTDWKVKMRGIGYVIIDDELYNRGFDDLLADTRLD